MSCFQTYMQRLILLHHCSYINFCQLKDDHCAFQKGVGCSEWRRGPHTGTQTHRQDCHLYSGQCSVWMWKKCSNPVQMLYAFMNVMMLLGCFWNCYCLSIYFCLSGRQLSVDWRKWQAPAHLWSQQPWSRSERKLVHAKIHVELDLFF